MPRKQQPAGFLSGFPFHSNLGRYIGIPNRWNTHVVMRRWYLQVGMQVAEFLDHKISYIAFTNEAQFAETSW